MAVNVTLTGQPWDVQFTDNLTGLWEGWDWLIPAMPDDFLLLGLDVETTGVDPWQEGFTIRTVQLANPGPRRVLVVGAAEHHTRTELLMLMRSPHVRYVTHSQFDAVALRKVWGLDLSGRVLDTLLLAQMVRPGDEHDHSLKPLVAEYLAAPELREAEEALHQSFRERALAAGDRLLARSPRKLAGWGFATHDVADETFVKYAALDAAACVSLAPALVRLLRSGRNLVRQEMDLADLATAMRVRGNLIDAELVAGLRADAQAEVRSCEALILSVTGLPSRSPYLVDWLVDHGVRFTVEEMTPAGRPSLAKQHLPGIVERGEGDEQARLVLQHRLLLSRRTNDEANLSSFLACADQDWRVHPDTKTLRARTARMSVTGPALQTLKKQGSLRSCFLADDGLSLVSADFSQVEVRVAAALSGERALIEPLIDGADVHSDTARRLFGDGFTEPDRKLAKIVNFASLYGGGAKTIAAQAGIGVLEAQQIVRKWRESYPSLTAMAQSLSERSEITTPTGRVIPLDPARPYAALNFLVQSTSRDLLVVALLRLVRKHPRLADALWLMVHDELIFQVPQGEAQGWAGLIKDEMATVLYGVPVSADADVLGPRWGAVH